MLYFDRTFFLLLVIEPGFVICDAPQVAEANFNRNKYVNRFLCWLSPQLLYTSMADKPKTASSTFPLRVLTATLAERVAALVNVRQVATSNKFDKQVELYKNSQ